MKYSIVFKQLLNTFGHSLHFKYPGPSPGYQCTAKPHGRDHRVWISVAQMIQGEHPIATEKSLSPPDSEQGAWGLSQPPLPSSPPPSPCCTNQIAPSSPLPEAAVGWAIYCTILIFSPISLVCQQWSKWILLSCKSPCFCSRTVQKGTTKSIFFDKNTTFWGRLKKSKKRI